MFRPNTTCQLRIRGANDVYGRPLPGATISEPCSIVTLKTRSAKSSVRADSSASRGSAEEFEADAVILLQKTTRARVDDILVVAGVSLKIAGIAPRNNARGQLDHYEVECVIWAGA